MARNFRRARSAQPIADLNVTNMIDLGFTLLIIFMISTPLLIQEQSIKLNLPTEPVRPQEKADNTPVQIISVDKTGRYFWGTTPVTLAELRGKLAEVAKRTTPPVINIRGDGDSAYKHVINAYNEVKNFPKLNKLSLQTQPEK
jgi:biopolymer transport protein TolR